MTPIGSPSLPRRSSARARPAGDPGPRPRGRAAITLVALASGVVFAGVDCGPVSTEELACENAVARLESCCPNFQEGAIHCEYGTSGECGRPFLGIPRSEAECIARMSCAQMAAAATCQRASAAAAGPGGWGWGGSTCP